MAQDKNSNNKDKVNLERYESGTSLRKLKLGYWFVEHRKYFIIAIVAILVFLSAGFFIYSSYNYGYYLLEGRDKDREVVSELSQTDPALQVAKQKNSAKDLTFYSPKFFKTGDTYDLMAKIKNPNSKYYANFTYCFLDGEKELSCQKDFIFPKENKYLLNLAQDLERSPQNLKVIMKSINWNRINYHKYPDWPDYYQKHLKFETSNIRFKPAHKELSKNVSLDVLEFEITNDTSYGYWEVPLNIVLFNGSEIVGVNRYIVDKFESGETKEVKLVWDGGIQRATEVKITPSIDIIDEGVTIDY